MYKRVREIAGRGEEMSLRVVWWKVDVFEMIFVHTCLLYLLFIIIL